MKPSPTLQMIATACGVGSATVSRALNGRKRCSPTTRKRILATAKKLGYRPDPALSILARRRWAHGSHPDALTLAWLHTHPGTPQEYPIFCGAAARAAELGYKLDPFNMREMPHSKIEKILIARGIRAIIVQSFTQSFTLTLALSRFTSVFAGPHNDLSQVHTVQADFRACVHLAINECIKRGYRRPGFLLYNFCASGTDTPILAQVLYERNILLEQFKTSGDQPPLLHYSANDANEKIPEIFRWIEQHQPDVLISSNITAYHWLKNPAPYGFPKLPALRFGKNLGFLLLRNDFPTPTSLPAHLDIRMETQGRECVNILHTNLHENSIGLPEVPLRILVPPIFRSRPTLPKKA